MIDIQIYGDQALLINFEQKIDADINEQVIVLHDLILLHDLPGFLYSIPAYCSLTVVFDPLKTDFYVLRPLVENLVQKSGASFTEKNSRKLMIPVCYEENFALDFEEVGQQTGLTREVIIQQHTSHEFRVFMLGFMPGFTYMGKLPQTLYCTRKRNPRLQVPKGSVGLAGFQTGIYPEELPGGWQIIGRTPLSLFNPHAKNPSLFQAGDLIRFRAIDANEYEDIEARIDGKTFNLQELKA